jgi:hypothetical protein
MKFLEDMDQVERISVARVQDGGLFKGASQQDLLARAAEVKLRDGWSEMLPFLLRKDVDVHLVSVGWSAAFIREALSLSGLPHEVPKVYYQS